MEVSELLMRAIEPTLLIWIQTHVLDSRLRFLDRSAWVNPRFLSVNVQ